MNVKQKRSRNNQFALRLSDSELALWNKKQSASGMNKTAFFIQMLKAATIKVFFFSDALKLLYHELRKIGVNLNQIAYLTNIDRSYEARDLLTRMSTEYFAVIDRLKSFLEHPLVNAYIVEPDELPQSLNPLTEVNECHSEM